MFKNFFTKLAFSFIITLLPLHSVSADSSLNRTKETLRILYWSAPTILNPYLSAGMKDWDASRIVYEPLASFDAEGNLVPFLAAEIPSLENRGVAEDGKSVVWKLKKGIRWSDGEPFTAADVLFTYQFISNPDVEAASVADYAAIESIQVADPYTVRIIFKDITPAWALPFVGVRGMILPRHKFQDYNGTNARDAPANKLPVGTGPYRAVPPGIKPQEVIFLGNDLIQTNKTVFEPNPYFREKGKPFFKRLEVRGGGTLKEAARLVLETGYTDFVTNLQLDAKILLQMEKSGKGKAIATTDGWVERIMLNFSDPDKETKDGERSSLNFPHPFFADKKVRQAFNYAIDREAIARLYGRNGYPTANMLVSPSKYRSDNTFYEFNLKKAAAFLERAGWRDSNGDGIRDKNGVKMKVVFQTPTNALRQETQKIIQKALQSVQVDVELKAIDASIFFSSDPSNPNTYTHFYADMQEYNDGNYNPDPGAYMRYLTCEQIPQKANGWAGENVGRWCNPAYDALYNKSSKEMDPKKRQQLFIRMNDMLIKEVVMIPLVDSATIHGVSATLGGAEFTPWDAGTWNIKDWRRISQ